MNYLDIKHCNMVNGDGLRTVIWLAGCDRNCPGCFSSHTHDPKAGVLFDKAAKDELVKDLTEDWCEGITYLGGDPLFPGNRKEVIALAKEIKKRFPNKTQWLYTGYTLEEIQDSSSMRDILKYVDVVVEGPFKQELISPDLHWVGSSNQRVIKTSEIKPKKWCILF